MSNTHRFRFSIIVGALALAASCGGSAPGEPPTVVTTPPATGETTTLPAKLKFASVSAGASHTCALTTEGVAWCWGANEAQELGRATETKYAPPGKVDGLDPVEGVSAGWNHTCVLARGQVRCWGTNAAQQIGPEAPASTSRAFPVAPGFADVVQVAAAGGTTCTARMSGDVWCWGKGTFRDRTPEPTAVPGTGGPHRIVQLDADTAYGCGRDDRGGVHCWSLGPDSVGKPATRVGGVPPVDQVATAQAFGCGVASESKRVWCWGRDPSKLPPREVAGLDAVAEVSAGGSTACARRRDGSVWCWGGNSWGQQGVAPAGPLGAVGRLVPDDLAGPAARIAGLAGVSDIDVGQGHVCAVHGDGGVSCWGRADFGQVGVGTDARVTTTATPVGHVPKALDLASGAVTSCALLPGGTVRCWSAPEALGGTFDVSSLSGADALAMGNVGGCALVRGRAWCWGTAWKGHPRTRDAQRAERVDGAPAFVQVASNWSGHRCGVTRSGEAWCWGHANSGDGLMKPYGPVQVPGAADVTQLTLNPWHGCVRQSNGEVACFPLHAANGQLAAAPLAGVEKVTTLGAGGEHCALTERGEVWCWGRDLQAAPRAVTPPNGLTTISLGYHHGCGLMAEGRVWCWGRNEVGQLGRGALGAMAPGEVEGVTGAAQLSAQGDHTCARTSDGKVLCWGSPDPAGRGPGAATITPVRVRF